LAAFPACQTTADEPTTEARSATPGLSLRIDLGADADPARIEKIGRHVEGLADVAAASVRIEKDGERTAVTVDVWGADLPTPEELESNLRETFPELAAAEITVTPAADAAPPALPDVKKIEDPAQAEKVIRDQLKAQGVEGAVDVKVVDGEDGERAIEVRVEQHE
jgi:hypothetical protein